MPDVTVLTPKRSPERARRAEAAPLLIPEFDRRQYEALFEPGTRLPKRALLIDRVGVAISRARRINRFVAVMVLSNIRSCTAASAVDMQATAQLLQCRLRPDDTVARIGDSVLVAVCNAINSDEDARLVARRMMEDTGIVCRIGITLSGEQHNPEVVLARALQHLSTPRRPRDDAPDAA
jgi:GGDEF domain-containing protein